MKFLDHTRQEGTCLFEFTGNTDHRQHDPQRPLRRGPCEGTQLNEEDILAEQRQTDAANPQDGLTAAKELRKLLAEKTTWAMAALGTLCGGAGVYLFGQL